MSLDEQDKRWIHEQFDAFSEALTDRLTETMRTMQTELLRAFHAHAEAVTIRLRTSEADESNLNAGLSQRMDVLERRLLEIEMKLDHTK